MTKRKGTTQSAKKRAPIANTPIATDSYSNIPARLGDGTSNLANAGSYPLIRMTQDYPLILSLFRSSWIIRRVVEQIPDDMLKAFPSLTTELKPEQIKLFERTVRKTGTLDRLRTTAKWGRLFGGAGAIIVIAGHDDLMQPLELDDIEPGSYKGLISLDRWSGIVPGPEVVSDFEDPVNFGLPRYYNCIMDAGTVNVHYSRILRFQGRELPNWEKQVELYWGLSEVEVVFDELKKRDYSSWNIVSLLTRAQILTIEEPQLAQMMSGASANNAAFEQYQNRMTAISELLNNQGLLVLGKDGKLNQSTYSFGGIADVYHEFMKDLCAAGGYPLEVIFGRESGLGSNGESGLQLYEDRVERERSSQVGPVMDQLLPVIAMSTWGQVPDDLDYKWMPIRTMSDKERSELAKTTFDSITAAFTANLMTQKEARMEIKQSSSATGLGSNITDEAIAATPDKYSNELGVGDLAEPLQAEEDDEKEPA